MRKSSLLVIALVLVPIQTVAQIITGQIVDAGGQVFNVKAYGAVGDGKTNDASAINTAIAKANAMGGTIFFPVGNFLVSSATSVITNPAVAIVCATPEASIITNQSTADTFKLQPSSNPQPYLGNMVENCGFVNNTAGTASLHFIDELATRVPNNGFQNQTGIEYEIQKLWAEREIVAFNSFYSCSKGIQFVKDASDPYQSFENNRLVYNQFQIFGGQIGISIEGGGIFYNGSILTNGNQNGTLISATGGASIQSTQFDLKGEGSGVTFSTDRSSSISGAGSVSMNGVTLVAPESNVTFSPLAGDINISESSSWSGTPAFFPADLCVAMGNRINGPLPAGTCLMNAFYDGIYYRNGGLGFNLLYNGSSYVTSVGIQNAAAAIFSQNTNGFPLNAFSIPSTGFAPQTFTPSQFSSYYIGNVAVVVNATYTGFSSPVPADSCSGTSVSVPGSSKIIGNGGTITVTPVGNPGNGLTWNAVLKSTDTVQLNLCNITASAITPTQQVYNILILRYQ